MKTWEESTKYIFNPVYRKKKRQVLFCNVKNITDQEKGF